MSETLKGEAIEIAVPAELGPTGAKDVHRILLSALEAARTGDNRVVIALDGDPAACSPLALQLLESAARSFPEDRISIGDPATAALATLSRTERS